MSMDSIVQIRMDNDMKTEVEELYRNMGTSFAEAVRMFARQSIKVRGMPFCPTLKSWEDMTPQDIEDKVRRANASIEAGRVYTADEVVAIMEERFKREWDKVV